MGIRVDRASKQRFPARGVGLAERRLVLGLAAAVLSGCATPPTMEDLAERGAAPAELKIVGPHGQLGGDAANAALARALDGVVAVDHARALLEREQALTRLDLTAGNAVTLLVDGPQAYAAMFEAIDNAVEHIHLETYILSDDEIGHSLVEKLIARRRQGVEVRIIYDALGSVGTSPEFFTRLRERGLLVKPFTIDPYAGDVNVRDHRKLLIVDGRTAFTGGINVTDDYSSSSFTLTFAARPESVEDGKNWRDTHLRIEGPAAHAFQGLFLRTWKTLPGNEPSPLQPYPPSDDLGSNLVRAVASTGGDDEHRIYSTFLSAIQSARSQIWLTHAYFSPDRHFLEALKDAARRGVDVRVMLPSVSDSSLVLYASQAHYAELMDAGVRLYLRQGAILHAKSALVDGFWSAIGSANLDYRSFLHNHEAIAVVVSRALAHDMAVLFERDLDHSQTIDPAEWASRGLWQRLMEVAASAFDYWL